MEDKKKFKLVSSKKTRYLLPNILTLAENNIKTLDNLAELDSEELFNLLGDKAFINEDDAGSVIMKARQHWFAEDKID